MFGLFVCDIMFLCGGGISMHNNTTIRQKKQEKHNKPNRFVLIATIEQVVKLCCALRIRAFWKKVSTGNFYFFFSRKKKKEPVSKWLIDTMFEQPTKRN